MEARFSRDQRELFQRLTEVQVKAGSRVYEGDNLRSQKTNPINSMSDIHAGERFRDAAASLSVPQWILDSLKPDANGIYWLTQQEAQAVCFMPGMKVLHDGK